MGVGGPPRSDVHAGDGLRVIDLGVADYQCITQPPSTLIVWPVTCAARSEARKTTMSAMSRGCCQRASGTTWRTLSPAQSSYERFLSAGCRSFHACHTARFKRVCTIPGQTVLTRTPVGARSFARHCAKLMLAAFDAL